MAAKKAAKKAVAEKGVPEDSTATEVQRADVPVDNDEGDNVFRKTYKILKRDWEIFDNDHQELHDRNYNDIRQQAINQGYRPTGDAYFTGTASGDGGSTVFLDYSVPVESARVSKNRHVRVPQEAGVPEAQEAP